MALKNPEEYLALVPVVRHSPGSYVSASYDEEGDVLYVQFKNPGKATDSELTDDDIIVRYEGDEVVGLTILRASQR